MNRTMFVAVCCLVATVGLPSASAGIVVRVSKDVSLREAQCTKVSERHSFADFVDLVVDTASHDGFRYAPSGGMSGGEMLYFDWQETTPEGRQEYIVTGVTGDPIICNPPPILGCFLAYVGEVETWASSMMIRMSVANTKASSGPGLSAPPAAVLGCAAIDT